jgi:hypothetical protein
MFSGMLDPDFAPCSSLFLFDKKWGSWVVRCLGTERDFQSLYGLYFRAGHNHGSDPNSNAADALSEPLADHRPRMSRGHLVG